MWEEGTRVALRCMTEAPFTGYSRRFVTMPPRNVVPKPLPEAAPAGVGRVQPPRDDPPRRAEGHRRARVRVHRSRRGPATGSTTTTRRSPTSASRSATPSTPTSRASRTFMCHPDEDEAHRAAALEGTNFFGYSLAHYYVFGRHRPGVDRRVGGVPAAARRARLRSGSGRAAARAQRPPRRQGRRGRTRTGLRGAVGTPDQVRDYLRRYEDHGVDQVILASQAGKTRHEHVMESLELFGREVLPEFMDRDEAAERRRRSASSPSSPRCSPASRPRTIRRSRRPTTPSRRSRARARRPRRLRRLPSLPRPRRRRHVGRRHVGARQLAGGKSNSPL